MLEIVEQNQSAFNLYGKLPEPLSQYRHPPILPAQYSLSESFRTPTLVPSPDTQPAGYWPIISIIATRRETMPKPRKQQVSVEATPWYH
ncbi:hypothetical protein Q4551_16095, partial [Oceanobacter sp. 5_MG-2023]|uniref:hypothetical protein n=1 Tax=Oceanobacter sp. 5_MG-2023 TaxID=3062645 RepID=UPI0026E3A000